MRSVARRAVMLGAAAALGACGSTPALEAPPDDPRAAITRDGLASREIELGDWGLGAAAELRYARVGILQQDPPTLVVYHLGASDPTAAPAGPPRSAPPPGAAGRTTVATFAGGNRNALGGFFNAFAKAPASATVAIDEVGEGARALVFDFDRRPGTFAGFWIHLFDSRAPRADRTYLDARVAAWLTFEVRGAAGGEPVRLQLADAAWEARQDSLPLGELGAYLPAGAVTAAWQRAWVPLGQVPARIDRGSLASLVFLVDPDGKRARAGRLEVRDVAFTADKVAPPPPPPADAAPTRPERRAMWLWETARILASEAEEDALLAFCREQGFTDLFVQIPFLAPRDPEHHHWSERWDEAGLRGLVTRLHGAGVAVYALDGAAWYARPEWHGRVLATVAQVAAYNAASPPAGRVVGVRFDIEPYLLPEWQGSRREAVLTDYLALLEGIVTIAHRGGLAVGVDLPFWFDAKDELTGALAAPIGGRPATEAIVDLADDIGVMDYRTVAYGADGVIAHAEAALAYAASAGKAVFIGLETVPLPDEVQETWDGGARSPWDVAGDLVVEPQPGGRARLTWVPRELRRADGRYPWLAAGARLLRRRDSLMVPADKITFAAQEVVALDRTLGLSRRELSHHASFAGFVIHSYESYRPWLERRIAHDSADADASHE